MIVLDASAAVELLLQTPAGQRVADRALDPAESLAAPHLLDVEVTQVLRRYALSGQLSADRGREALIDLADLPMTRYPHDLLLQRVFELRENLTAYDAVYVALAEVLGGVLLTRDAKTAAAPGIMAQVELIA